MNKNHKTVDSDIQTILHDEWTPWRETVGFVIRRITRKTVKKDSTLDAIITIEFDICDGNLEFITRVEWTLNDNFTPRRNPICTPLSFSEAISPNRIYTRLSEGEALERLLESVRQCLNASDER